MRKVLKGETQNVIEMGESSSAIPDSESVEAHIDAERYSSENSQSSSHIL